MRLISTTATITLLVGLSVGCGDVNEGEPDAAPACLETGTPGVMLTAASGNAREGEAAVTYTATLIAAPCADVTLNVMGDEQVTASPTSLLFTADDWDQAQMISVSANQDSAREGSHTGVVSHSVASEDSRYDGLAVDDMTIAIDDRANMWHISAADGAASDGDSRDPSVSDDGRYVAFTSDAANLVAGDTGAFSDVFVRDTASGTTLRVSEVDVEADGDSLAARIAADGGRISYRSLATNLTNDPISNASEVYLYDQTTGLTALVSAQCVGCSNELSGPVPIAADGGRVAYSTRRTLLGDPDGEYDVFVYDAAQGDTTAQASLNSQGENGVNFWGSNAFGSTLSATGRFVGFASAARNLALPDLTVMNFHAYVKDMDTGTLTRVSLHSGGTANCDGLHQASNSSSPHISSDGNLAAFHSDCVFTLAEGVDGNGATDVMVRDIAAQTTMRVSVASDGKEGDGASRIVAISDDGRYVAFLSDATNLVADDTNGAMDLFVRDMMAGTTRRVSVDLDYAELGNGVTTAGMSRNGQFVVYSTVDNIIAESDDNVEIQDLYMLQLW